MELNTILIVISAILGVVGIVLGNHWLKAKGKLNEVKNLSKESFDLIKVAIEAIEDDKITPDEVQKIKDEALEVRTAWRVLIGRTP